MLYATLLFDLALAQNDCIPNKIKMHCTVFRLVIRINSIRYDTLRMIWLIYLPFFLSLSLFRFLLVLSLHFHIQPDVVMHHSDDWLQSKPDGMMQSCNVAVTFWLALKLFDLIASIGFCLCKVRWTWCNTKTFQWSELHGTIFRFEWNAKIQSSTVYFHFSQFLLLLSLILWTPISTTPQMLFSPPSLTLYPNRSLSLALCLPRITMGLVQELNLFAIVCIVVVSFISSFFYILFIYVIYGLVCVPSKSTYSFLKIVEFVKQCSFSYISSVKSISIEKKIEAERESEKERDFRGSWEANKIVLYSDWGYTHKSMHKEMISCANHVRREKKTHTTTATKIKFIASTT